MKNWIKKFPLTSYATVVVLVALFLIEDKPRDEILPIDPAFWVLILSIPLIGISQIYSMLGVKIMLPYIVPCLLLDLILLYLRTHLIPKIKSKLKSNLAKNSRENE